MNRLTDKKRNYIELGCIAIALLVIYNATLPTNLAASHDSIGYLELIEGSTTPWLFHAHHLLYAVLGRAFWQMWLLLGYTGDALLPLQELNIIFACLSIVVLHMLLKRAFGSRLISLLICTAVAFSFGFWLYSSVVEVYMIPLFFLILSFSLTYYTFQNPGLKVFVAIGVSNALAILFHQMNILFVVVVLGAILLNHKLSRQQCRFLEIIHRCSLLYSHLSRDYYD